MLAGAIQEVAEGEVTPFHLLALEVEWSTALPSTTITMLYLKLALTLEVTQGLLASMKLVTVVAFISPIKAENYLNPA